MAEDIFEGDNFYLNKIYEYYRKQNGNLSIEDIFTKFFENLQISDKYDLNDKYNFHDTVLKNKKGEIIGFLLVHKGIVGFVDDFYLYDCGYKSKEMFGIVDAKITSTCKGVSYRWNDTAREKYINMVSNYQALYRNYMIYYLDKIEAGLGERYRQDLNRHRINDNLAEINMLNEEIEEKQQALQELIDRREELITLNENYKRKK